MNKKSVPIIPWDQFLDWKLVSIVFTTCENSNFKLNIEFQSNGLETPWNSIPWIMLTTTILVGLEAEEKSALTLNFRQVVAKSSQLRRQAES